MQLPNDKNPIGLQQDINEQLKAQADALLDATPQEFSKEEVPEAMLVDPELVLTDLKEIFVKHEVDFPKFLSALGFDEQSLFLFLSKKTVSETIYELNRRMSLMVWRMGQTKPTPESEAIPTQDIRGMLGNCPASKEWLTLMDEVLVPYVKEYHTKGQLDEFFFEKDVDGLFIFGPSGERIQPQVERPTLEAPGVPVEETPEEA